jgi:hypothetical protein
MDASTTSMRIFGWLSRNLRITSGRIRTPTLSYAPIRMCPAVPLSSFSTSTFAACKRATIASRWLSRILPASVGPRALRPCSRATTSVPTIRSRLAICWLIAEGV